MPKKILAAITTSVIVLSGCNFGQTSPQDDLSPQNEVKESADTKTPETPTLNVDTLPTYDPQAEAEKEQKEQAEVNADNKSYADAISAKDVSKCELIVNESLKENCKNELKVNEK